MALRVKIVFCSETCVTVWRIKAGHNEWRSQPGAVSFHIVSIPVTDKVPSRPLPQSSAIESRYN